MNTNPNILEFKKEHKIKNGLFLMIVGLAAIAGTRFPSWFEGLPIWVLPVIGWGSLIPGMWILFGLSVHRFDRELGTVTSKWGLIIPFKIRKRPISDFRTVLIYKERQSETRSRGTSISPEYQDRRSYFIYPVKIICEDEPPEMKLINLLDNSDRMLDVLKNSREHGVKLKDLENKRKLNGCASITIGKPRNHTKALEMGQKIADFLGINLCDLGVHK